MANDEHVALLKQGVAAWNAWRNENPDIVPDLRREHLSGMNLTEANLIEANLSGAYLHGAFLFRANLSGANLCGTQLIEAHLRGATLNGANLSGAVLSEAELSGVNLSGANLSRAVLFKAYLGGADLSGANLSEASLNAAILTGADLREANLSGADLTIAHLIDTDFSGADLTGCRIYGVSAWRLKLKGAKQENLVITRTDEPAITVDNIEIAQFIYLMLNNEKVRDVIDTITSKVVLILGRFTDKRKAVLNALREELRKRDYLPILFDFEKSSSRNTDETITLIARMARFVVADISDAKSVLQELRAIVPDLPSVPDASQEQLIADLGEKVIRPAELKVPELQGRT
jgi:uncharacterized protein YjbI with pentapeptide repeats